MFLPLQQAVLARLADAKRRTSIFARYALVGALAGACGALFAGFPELAQAAFRLDAGPRWNACSSCTACLESSQRRSTGSFPSRSRPSPKNRALRCGTRGGRGTAAALFSLDSFGQRLHRSVAARAVAVPEVSAFGRGGRDNFLLDGNGLGVFLSGCGAHRRSLWPGQHDGLHAPSVEHHAVARAAGAVAGWAIALLVMRSALSQMDVPTRNSYVMAIVPAGERAAAASLTAVAKSFASSIGPLFAGYLLGVSGFGWPLVIGGSVKIVYDLLLLATFRNVRPPRSRRRAGRRSTDEFREVADREGARSLSTARPNHDSKSQGFNCRPRLSIVARVSRMSCFRFAGLRKSSIRLPSKVPTTSSCSP